MSVTTKASINKYLDKNVHWHPKSQPYASGHQLNSKLNNGWIIDNIVFRTEHHVQVTHRTITFYVIVLIKDGEKLNMPVLANPFVDRIVKKAGVKVFNVERHNKHFESSKPKETQELAIAN